MAEEETKKGEEEEKDEQPKNDGVSVDIGKAKLKPTLRLTPPEGGWNPKVHQKPKKPIGKSKY